MRHFFAITAFLLLSSAGLHAQNGQSHTININNIDSLPQIVKPARDFVMLQFGYTNWQSSTTDTNALLPKTKPFAYTLNAYLCYDFPIKKTKMSFATGLGIHTSVSYLKKQQLSVDDTGVNGRDASFIVDTANYKRYKFNTAYIQAPFELRYYSNINNRNKGFKAAIGLQVGTLLGGHTKGLRSVEGNNVKETTNFKRYLSPWNFAATARVGWGNFTVFGTYNITPVFKDKAGPVITPVTVGICLSGL